MYLAFFAPESDGAQRGRNARAGLSHCYNNNLSFTIEGRFVFRREKYTPGREVRVRKLCHA